MTVDDGRGRGTARVAGELGQLRVLRLAGLWAQDIAVQAARDGDIACGSHDGRPGSPARTRARGSRRWEVGWGERGGEGRLQDGRELLD